MCIRDRLKNEATGVYVAPRTRIITEKDRIVRPEQLRVARRMIRDYQAVSYTHLDVYKRQECPCAARTEEWGVRPLRTTVHRK